MMMTQDLTPDAVAKMLDRLTFEAINSEIARAFAGDIGALLKALAAERDALSARVEKLEAERDQAREWLGAANNEFGSAAWNWPDLWRRIAHLKELSSERWTRAEAEHARGNTLADKLVATSDREARLIEALTLIAAEINIPVPTWKNGINFKRLYEAWRKQATTRADISRALLAELEAK
jgi:hypothetical protein